MYHRFGDDRYPSTNISNADFEAHLHYLAENNFDVITLGQAIDLLNNHTELSQKTVVLTIDDGYKSFLENGMPLLRKYGFKATLFVNTNASGSDLLNWDEIISIENEGIEIGNHSHAHPYFVNVGPADIPAVFKEELELSDKIFEAHLGHSPDLFAYPYGEYNREMRNELQRRGFKAAAAQHSGVISNYSDRFALPRFPSAGTYSSLKKFIEKANMKALPVVAINDSDPLFTGVNPPVLKLKLLHPDEINLRSLGCFVAGTKKCTVEYEKTDSTIAIRSALPLTQRRTLYTLTAMSVIPKGGWYWYSFLWIIPD